MTEITQVSDDKGLHKALTVKIRRSDVNIEQSRKKIYYSCAGNGSEGEKGVKDLQAAHSWW